MASGLPSTSGPSMSERRAILISNPNAWRGGAQRGRQRPVHIGCAIDESTGERRYFFLMAGVGLDASIVRRVRPRLKRRVGEVAFWYSGLEHLAGWQPTPFQMEVDGHTFPATFAAI